MKKTKIIFLDIDGVLATNKQFGMNVKKFREKNEWAMNNNVPYPFDTKCVDIFNEILEETNAEIILSSDWKLHWDLIKMDLIFKKNNLIRSPRMMTKNDSISFGNITKNRVHEIELFLKDFEFVNYVIIDDLPLENYLKDPKKFVKTIDSEGLKQKSIKNKIIEILNNNG